MPGGSGGGRSAVDPSSGRPGGELSVIDTDIESSVVNVESASRCGLDVGVADFPTRSAIDTAGAFEG